MNEGNLIPFNKRTESEQREIARSGGKASGRARGFRAAFKKRMRDNPELADAVLDSLLMAVGEGNVAAIKTALEMNGEAENDQDKKLKKAQVEKLKADTERIKADTERIKAETELLRRKAADVETADGDAAAALTQALDSSAAAVWEKGNDNADKTGEV